MQFGRKITKNIIEKKVNLTFIFSPLIGFIVKCIPRLSPPSDATFRLIINRISAAALCF